MDTEEAIKSASTINIIIILFIMFFFLMITIIVNRDVKKKVIKPMHSVTEGILNVGTEMKLYKNSHLEKIYLAPNKYFMDLLTRMEEKV